MSRSEKYIQPTNNEEGLRDDKDNNRKNKFEKKENISKLHEFSRATSQKIIQEYGEEIVNDDVSINRDVFKENANYTKEEIEEDDEFVKKKRKKFDKDKLKDSNGQLFEEVIACIFYRILKKNYLVVRSSDYDDFRNGVDLLIIDLETNEVICAVDDITTYNEDLNAIERKEKKVLDQNINGGAEMKYGLAFKKNEQSDNIELIRGGRKEIPIFSMHLSGKELDELLNGMEYDINNNPSEIELETFDELIRLMRIESREMQEKIEEKSMEDIDETENGKIRLNYLLNVKMKDIERKISKANSKRKKGLIDEKKAIEKDIKSLKNDIDNFPVRKKNRTTSLAHLEETFDLFEKIKEVRNESFSKIEM